MNRKSARFALAAVLGAAVVAATTTFAAAQEIPTAKIAVLDTQKILRNSSAAAGIRDQVKQQREIYQDEFARQERELRAAEEELTRQRTILSSEAFALKRREFAARVAAVERGVETRKRELDQAYGTGIKQVERALASIITELAKEHGFNLVLSRTRVQRVVLYADSALNISDEVLLRLNKRLPSVKVPLAQN